MTIRQSVTINGFTWYYSGSPAAWPQMAAGISVTGKSGVNTQFSGAGNDIMTGGGGGSDNIFYVNANDTVIAGKTDGIDTEISYWGSLTLAAGVTNGTMNGPGILTGNALNNILTVEGAYAATIVAGSGNDLLIGSTTGTDRFIVDGTNGGSATIVNFRHGVDVVQLNNFSQAAGASLATLESDMTQSGNNVILAAPDGQTITFANTTIGAFTASDFAVPVTTAGLRLTFDDEFNTLNASASGIGTTWQFMSGTLAANHEAENYLPTATGANAPFSINNGVLDITARPVSTAAGLSYTSGGLTTRQSFAQTYGLFEVNCEMPAGAGMWPAFWLLPASGGWPPEIDAPEVLGSNPNVVYLSTHSNVNGNHTTAVTLPTSTATGFHTYGVDWEPSTITYYFDGNAIASLPTPADCNQPMYMLLNLAVGGTGSWPGAAAGETGQLLVNWVRAYQSTVTPPSAFTLSNWSQWIVEYAGNYTVTGTGGGGTIKFGDGNDVIKLTAAPGTVQGSQNTITIGNGNELITTQGNSNTITTGVGASIINAGVSYNKVTVAGVTPGATTTINAAGYGNSFTSTGPGTIIIGGGTTGSATVRLGDGNQTVVLGGGSNTVTTGAGNSTINAGNGNAVVTTGAGNSAIAVIGYNNVLDAGPGNNTISGGYGYDRYILNPAGSGVDTLTSFTAANHDILDFTQALAGLAATPTATSLMAYVTARQVASGTVLSIDPTGHGGASAVEVAMLSGVKTTMTALVTGNNIEIAGKIF